jgi:hypothetical protein
MNGPIPTRLVFIHELPSLPLHTKVRFLGWYVNKPIIDTHQLTWESVTRYDDVRGRLEIEHNYPPLLGRKKKSDASSVSRKVSVDIYHVLKTLTRDQVEVGSWLNVFGYIRSEIQGKEDADNSQLYVEAVMISDAGAIRIAEYEQSLTDMQAINRKLQLQLNT